MRPTILSAELRQGSGPFLARRRGVAGLSLAAIGAMGLISLYQLGIIEHLPEPLPRFDADQGGCDGGGLRLPGDARRGAGPGELRRDPGLAAMGGADRATTRPWLPLLLAAKVGLDTAAAGKLTADQWTKHRAFCFWCLLASAATFATIPLVIPEARAALRRLGKE